MIDLTILVQSITHENVWDLPLWLWRGYRKYVDDTREKVREASRGR